MGQMTKADFYYGGLISAMLNRGVKPALFEENDSTRIYEFLTNNGKNLLYVKYVSKPGKSVNGNKKLWTFTFTDEEINTIKTGTNDDKKISFGLVCGVESLKDSEIAILTLDEAKKCLGTELIDTGKRISVFYEKGRRGLFAYGSGLSDVEPINIPRDAINNL